MCCPSLNEGRGRDPGDTSQPPARGACEGSTKRSEPRLAEFRESLPNVGFELPKCLLVDLVPRSTKAGAETPATRHASRLSKRAFASRSSAQRRPGPRPRRHIGRRQRPRGMSWPLNEGRGRDPGEHAGRRSTTGPTPAGRPPISNAQRRPGPRPRRHSPCPPEIRSLSRLRAQRRPGPRPRRHSYELPSRPRWRSPSLNEGRGRPRRHHEVPGSVRRPMCVCPIRSTKAGAETPATPLTGCPLRASGQLFPRPLNEGRGRDPGDTSPSIRERQLPCTAQGAQRRPGPRPRRHLAVMRRRSVTAHFGAQRRPGPRPRRHC